MRYFLVLLMILVTLPAGAPAANLFDAARVFPLTYCGDMVEAADFTGDDILDLVTARVRLSVMVGAGDGSFTEVVETTGVLSPVSMVTGDLNGDGLMDVALGDDYGTTDGLIRVLLGNGDGTFKDIQTYPTLESPIEMGIDDLDNDGDLDLVVIDDYADTGAAHLNDGNGAFGPAIVFQTGEVPLSLVLGQFNGDGHPDLAVTHYSEDGLWVYSGNGNGTFTTGPSFVFDSYAAGLAAGDVNGDGSLDLVATTFTSGPDPGLHVLLGDGSGGFTVFQQIVLHQMSGRLSLVRMNEDQTLDIVIDHFGIVAVMTGNGDGTFGEILDSGVVKSWNERFTFGDMDRDGDQDLIMPLNSDEPGMSVILNRGDGSLQTAPTVQLFDGYTWSETADLDGDGDLDVVVTSEPPGSRNVRTLLNDGDGNFVLRYAWSTTGTNEGLHFSVGDLNSDGIPDLAVTLFDYYTNDGFIAILIGVGDGTFFMPSSFVNQGDLFQSHLWHLNGDAHLDLVAVRDEGIWVAHGLGGANFNTPSYVAVGSRPTLADAADLDGNGTLDLAFFNSAGDYFSVIFGNGSGGFSAPVDYDVDHEWLSLDLGDLDGDGAPDLVYIHDVNPVPALCVRLNDGSGAFLGETTCFQGLNIGQCRLADITGDGWLDAVSANVRSFSVHPGLGDGGFGEVLRFGTFGYQVSPPASGDFDGDGDIDLMVGRDTTDFTRWGLYFRNTTSLGNIFAAGPGRGENNPPQVRTFTLAGSSVLLVDQWQAYGVSRYGVNVALGELDGSEGLEVLTGSGPGEMFGPHVRGFESTGVPLPGVSFLAYGTNRWGVNVAAGDIDADGYDEIVTGAGPGEVFGPHVRAWNWDGSGVPEPIPGTSWFAYGTPKYGVKVCCGDIDGDGFDEIITGAGPGAVYGPHVRGWNCDGGAAVAISGVSFLALGTNKFGINVGCGDLDGDGIDEIVTGAGPGAVFGPHVRGWNWDGSGTVQPIAGISFFAYDYTEWGANVSCGDLDGDGYDEILTGPGPGESHEPRIRGWNYDGAALTAMEAVDFYGFDPGEVTHGVKPAGLRAGRR